MEKLEKLVLILYNLKKNPERDYKTWDGGKTYRGMRSTDSMKLWTSPVDKNKDSIIKKAMQNMGKPIDEITSDVDISCKGIESRNRHQVDPAQDLLNGKDIERLVKARCLMANDDSRRPDEEYYERPLVKVHKMMKTYYTMKKSDGPFTVVAMNSRKF